jgi:hypothetical protein
MNADPTRNFQNISTGTNLVVVLCQLKHLPNCLLVEVAVIPKQILDIQYTGTISADQGSRSEFNTGSVCESGSRAKKKKYQELRKKFFSHFICKQF